MTEFYIYAEDLAAAVIGPFPTLFHAAMHVLFCAERGDAAFSEHGGLHRIVDEDTVVREDMRYLALTLTPEQDRAYSSWDADADSQETSLLASVTSRNSWS